MSYAPYKIEDVRRAAAQKKFTAISMFSGAGGGSMGVKLAGGDIRVANEFVAEARRIYETNHKGTVVLPNDIRELSGDDFLRAGELEKGEVDLIEASPPCSSFSMSGLRESGWGVEKKYSDTTQRTDDLFFEFARVLGEIQPRFFICENVKGLTLGSAANVLGSAQLGMFGEHEDTIYHQLINQGYKVRYKVLNSKHFFVPQSRERLIIVGVRNDIDFTYRYPKPATKSYTTLKEAFVGVENSNLELAEADIDRYAIGKELRRLAIGQQSDKYFSLQKMDPNKPSNTLTQTAGNISAASIASWENRKFTRGEAIRIQGFPDDMYLGDTYANVIERLGRSVTPILYKYVINNLPF